MHDTLTDLSVFGILDLDIFGCRCLFRLLNTILIDFHDVITTTHVREIEYTLNSITSLTTDLYLRIRSEVQANEPRINFEVN